MAPTAAPIKKIRTFRLAPRPSAVMRHLKALLENAQASPELEKDVEAEARAAQNLLETAALYTTLDRDQPPDWSAPLWTAAPEEPAPVALTFFTATIGLGLESELAQALSRGETFRSRVLTALGEELADQAAHFVERLVAEEAHQESCELGDRRALSDDATARRVLGLLDAGRVGVAFDAGSHLAPRFTRVGVLPWGPPSKKRK